MFTNTFKHPNRICLVNTYPQSIDQFEVPTSATSTSVKINGAVEYNYTMQKQNCYLANFWVTTVALHVQLVHLSKLH